MIDISWGEMLVVGAVALIVIGPEQLPATLRGIGRATTRLKAMASDFRGQFDDAMREAELHDLGKNVSDLRSTAQSLNPIETIRSEITDAVSEIRSVVQSDGDGARANETLRAITRDASSLEAELRAGAQSPAPEANGAPPPQKPIRVSEGRETDA
jgi:sec-independent protein translocase protein TatB